LVAEPEAKEAEPGGAAASRLSRIAEKWIPVFG
jgi:hypothetical protein